MVSLEIQKLLKN